MRKFLRVLKKECPNGYRIRCALLTAVMGLFLTDGVAQTVTTYAPMMAKSEVVEAETMKLRVSPVMTIGGEQLMKIHPTNLLKALQLLEPSLVLDQRSRNTGNDPNYSPSTITFNTDRSFGQNAAGRSNVLVIVDGYEISYERLADFDITRVYDVRIIKDAASSITYGTRGANGVIEIRTKTPKSGDVSLTYRFDGSWEAADKKYYDLMNARQKLDLEKDMGMYAGNEALYNERLGNGNTDWLDIPLRTPFRNRHHISVEGGDQTLSIMAGLMLEPGNNGAMKDSKRDRYGAIGVINYHSGRLRVSDYISADLIRSRASSYGDLYEYMIINPYYSPYDNNGKAVNILGEDTFSQQYSPLYEASLSNFNKGKSTRFQNNLMASFDIADYLTLRGSFAFTRDYVKYDQFISPSSNVFAHISDANMIGSYEIRREDLTVYEEHLDLDFRKNFDRHNVSGTIGIHSYASKIYADNYEGLGISNDNMAYVSFAKRYNYARRPGGREYKDRLFGAYIKAGYDYDGRYTAQTALRLDRSSQFSPDKQWAPSWSVGAGWNIHAEKWAADSRNLTHMRLSAGIGQMAASQAEYNMVNPTYYYNIDDPYIDALTGQFGLVSLMQNLGYNDALKWRTDTHMDVRLTAMIFKRLFVDVSYYHIKSTDIALQQQKDPVLRQMASWVNDGEVTNQGLQFSLTGNILNKQNLSLNLVVTGVANKSEIKSAPKSEYIRTGSYLYSSRLYTGVPVDAIFAYKSTGIDASTGMETYDNSSYASYGSATPNLAGTFGITGTAGQWDFGCLLSYSLGGKVYDWNTQMFVDQAPIGASGPVQILEKWRKSGDQAKYQGFDDIIAIPSSRFVKDENALSLGSVYVGYKFDSKTASKLYMKGLHIGLTGNDLFYFSSAKIARGILYPYTRSVTLSLKATF